jgi:hypothetical protein
MSKSFFKMLAFVTGIALSGLAAAPASAMQPVTHSGASHGIAVPARHIVHPGIRHLDNHPRLHRHFRSGFYIAPVYSYRSYDDGCYWLKRKALRTGSRYWWHRYNECRWG